MRRRENKEEAERREGGQRDEGRRGWEEKRGKEEDWSGRRSAIGEHRKWWKKRGTGAHRVGREGGGGGREDEEEEPLLQSSAELRNSPRLGIGLWMCETPRPRPS